MKTRFLCHVVFAFLTIVVPCAVEAAEPGPTAAQSPPSNPLGDQAITDNNLDTRVELYEEEEAEVVFDAARLTPRREGLRSVQ